MHCSTKQRIGWAGSTLVILGVTVASAQDATPVRNIALTFSQDFRATDNQALEADSAGTTFRAATRLGISAQILNEITQLNLNTSTGLRYVLDPSGDTRTETDQPRLNLSYSRAGATTNLNASASYRSEEIEFIRPLEDFVSEDGEIALPDDALDLEGTGRRTDYSVNLGATFRRDAPLSFSVNLGLDRRSYTDVSDPGLYDTATDRYGASLNFRINPVSSATLSYSASQYRAEDTEETTRDSQRVSLGYSRELNKVLSMTANLGYSMQETEENGITEETDSATGALQFTLARPNGTIGAGFNTALTPNGTRQNLTLSRSLDLPNGQISANVGLTRLSETDAYDTTASISYSQPLPTGQFSLSLNRSVIYDEDTDQDDVRSTLSAGYSHQINDLSSVSLNGAFSTREDIRRVDFSASHSYALTEDWALSTGYNYDRREDGADDAESHAVFLRFNRRFDLPF